MYEHAVSGTSIRPNENLTFNTVCVDPFAVYIYIVLSGTQRNQQSIVVVVYLDSSSRRRVNDCANRFQKHAQLLFIMAFGNVIDLKSTDSI